jgi:hypothetical protein
MVTNIQQMLTVFLDPSLVDKKKLAPVVKVIWTPNGAGNLFIEIIT